MEWCKVRVVSSKELNDHVCRTINMEEVKGRGDKMGTGNFTDKIQAKTSISNDESKTNCTGPSLPAFPCYRFPAVLTLERASPVSPQADLNMLVYRDRVRHTRVNLRTSSLSGVVDFQLQGNPELGLYFRRIQSGCNYTLRYADKTSTSGYYVSDLPHFETLLANSEKANSSAPIVFGCLTRALEFTTSFLSADGIFGLGQNSLSVISQLTSQNAAPMVLSHCLRGDSDAGGGFLVLGAAVELNMVYTPVVTSLAQYNVHLQSIYVNGRSMGANRSLGLCNIR